MATRPQVLQVGKYFAPYRGGIETHLELLATGLSKSLGVRIVVAGGGRFAARTSYVEGLEVTRLATPLTLAATPFCPALASAIRSSAADLVHLHFPNPMAALAYLLSGVRTPLVITWHSDIVRQRWLAAALQPLIDAVLARADAVIVTSPNYRDTSKPLRPWLARVHVIPYGIPAADIGSVDPHQVEQLHRRYGRRLVLGVGRLVYYKGWEYLIDAMKEVDATLLIVGDGPLRSALQRRVDAGGLGERVMFVGALPWRDILPYYQACQVFALASIARSEAFGIVQLEAMAAGRPVVNTKLDSGVPFVSVDGVSGLTVAARDSIAMAGALNCLLDDPALAAGYGQMGARRVKELFSLEAMVRGTVELYSTILDSGARPPLFELESPIDHARISS